MIKRNNHKIAVDIFWYLAGTALPLLTLFLRSPIYTRIFYTEEYGQYSLVHITYTYLSMVQFSWLINSCWRFYLKYKKGEKIKVLNSILFSLFTLSSLVLLVVMIIWSKVSCHPLTIRLVIYGFFFFTSQEALNLLLVPMRIEGKAKRYNLIHSSKAVISFGLLLYLTFIRDYRIEAFYLSAIIVNIAYLLPIAITRLVKKPFAFLSVRKEDFREIFRYGMSGIILNISILILISSDRYIIALFYSKSEVGIYNQIYNLGQISLAAIINVFLNAVNPDLLDTLEQNIKNAGVLIKRFIYMLIYLFLPIAILLSVFSEQLAFIMLGPDFRVAWNIIPYIMFSALIYGLCHFSMMRFRFENRLKVLVLGGVIAAVVNVGMNFIFIPHYGYKWAAYTTLAAYIVMLLYYYVKDSTKFFSDKKYMYAVVTSLILLGMFTGLKNLLHQFQIINTLVVSIIEGVVYLALFYAITLKLNPFYSRSKYAE